MAYDDRIAPPPVSDPHTLKMYPTTDSPNHLMDIPTDNRGWVANSGLTVRSLVRNDDVIALRSTTRRTRGVCFVSEGASYKRIDSTLEGSIEETNKRPRGTMEAHQRNRSAQAAAKPTTHNTSRRLGLRRNPIC